MQKKELMSLNFKIVLFIGLLSFSYACSPKQKTSVVVDPDDTMPGRVVVAVYADSTPGIVQYYKLDSAGKLTQELAREVHYYQGKKKYTDCSFTTLKEDSVWRAVKDGPAFAYHENGVVQTKAFYVNGKEQGEYKVYRDNGKLLYEGSYESGQRVGEWKFYHKNGRVGKLGHYENGICVGKWVDYTTEGRIVKTITSDETTIACGDCPKCKSLIEKEK